MPHAKHQLPCECAPAGSIPRAVQGPYTGSKATRALWRAPAQGQTEAAVGAARERKLRRKRRRLHDLVFLHHDQPLGLLLELEPVRIFVARRALGFHVGHAIVAP